MFGTLRNLANRAKAAFTKVRAVAQGPAYHGPAVRVVTRRQEMALRLAAAKAARTHPQHYPELSCRNGRAKGRKSRSLKQRSNRRKAAARAKA